jgi:hypothetical protein
MPGGIKTHCLYHLAIPHYQKFVQKKLKTRRVISLEYQSFLILIGFVKMKATSHMLVKNFLLGLLELRRLYLFVRPFKKKRPQLLLPLRRFHLFTTFNFLRLRRAKKVSFLLISCLSTFFLKKGNGKLAVKPLKRTKRLYNLNLWGRKMTLFNTKGARSEYLLPFEKIVLGLVRLVHPKGARIEYLLPFEKIVLGLVRLVHPKGARSEYLLPFEKVVCVRLKNTDHFFVPSTQTKFFFNPEFSFGTLRGRRLKKIKYRKSIFFVLMANHLYL